MADPLTYQYHYYCPIPLVEYEFTQSQAAHEQGHYLPESLDCTLSPRAATGRERRFDSLPQFLEHEHELPLSSSRQRNRSVNLPSASFPPKTCTRSGANSRSRTPTSLSPPTSLPPPPSPPSSPDQDLYPLPTSSLSPYRRPQWSLSPPSPSSPSSSSRRLPPYKERPKLKHSHIFSSYPTPQHESAYDQILEQRNLYEYLAQYSLTPSTSQRNMANTPLKRKVVILGAPSVGKTSITQQYVTPPTYNDQYYPTIEATSNKTVKYKGVEYDCEIVDTAGQDEFSLFPPKYAVGVHGYMLVYSITSKQSFEMIRQLHDKILDQGGQDRVPCVIVGQKKDLNAERRVTTAEGEKLAKDLKAGFIETSAKDNNNVDRAFDALLAEMQKEYNPAAEPKKKSGWWPF